MQPGRSEDQWNRREERGSLPRSFIYPASFARVRGYSFLHALEQPSPDFVLPSSHSSPAWRRPLPQMPTQTLGEPLQTEANSTLHLLSQPSPSSVFASSHFSLVATTPSPQTERHRVGWAPLQLKPVSIMHVLEQPSFPSALPSSHCSLPEM